MKLLYLLLFISSIYSQQYLKPQNFSELYSISISGPSIKSGTYYLPNSSRILDVINSASDTFNILKINYRNVIVSNIDTFDILKYIINNDESQNPFIQIGSKIFIDCPVNFITINGDISTISNVLPIKENETIKSIFTLCKFTSTSDSTICLIRDRQNNEIFYDSEFKLKHGDYLIVNSKKSIKEPIIINVVGESLINGNFSIDTMTKCNDIIKKIGLTSQADISKIYVIRKSKKNVAISNSVRPEILASIKNMSVSGDFQCIHDMNIVLMANDEIVVPKIDNYVYVSGNVKKQGAYLYEKNKTIDYYIDLSDGFTKSADKKNVRVVTLYGNNYKIKDVNEISNGDIIVIPEKAEFKRIKEVTPIIQIISSALTLIVTLLGLGLFK